jgi:hypothetical protein
VSVTVVSCVYGDRGYERFIPRWAEAVLALDPRPDHVLVAGDGAYGLPPFIRSIIRPCPWLHPQAFYLQQAIEAVTTEWVWIVDIDDLAFPDALAGLDDVDADVWAVGFLRSDGELYLPPPLTGRDVLDAQTSVIPAGSMIRTAALLECGGFRDVALQDWALWRALADRGAVFASSDRAHYRYERHPVTRGATELTAERRPAHLAEMMATEGTLVVAG